MRSYVDLAGSGEVNTRIYGTVAGSGSPAGIIRLVDNMVLSDVTIENLHTNLSVQGTGITYVPGSSSYLRARRVTLLMTQPTNVVFATYFEYTTVDFDAVTIVATGGTSSNQGFRIDTGTGIFRNGVISAGTAILDPIGFSSTFRVVNSMINGGTSGGTRTCVGAYNGAYVALNSTCN